MANGLMIDPVRSIHNYLRIGIAVSAFLAFGVGGWAAITEIAGAVIASGQVVVESYAKKVQHQTGGIVAALNVQEGTRVKAGDVVIRLDDTVAKATLAIANNNLDELLTRQARLLAERDDSKSIDFPRNLLDRQVDPAIARQLNSERRLFELRSAARAGQKSQLQERIQQSREQITGLEKQIDSKQSEAKFIGTELTGLRDLWKKNLVPISKVTALERDAARIEGEQGQLVATLASTKGKITETEMQILQVDQDLRSEVAKELRDVSASIAEATEKKVTAEDQLKRIDIRAPQNGIVHQLTMHTVGGVVQAGEAIMTIVPDQDALAVEVKVSPHDIDQIQLGQKAVFRLTAFNQRTTPELNGKVYLVSADAETDQRSGASFYLVRITLEPDEVAKLGGLRIVPGMPVESFIKTTDRTVISYLMKPLSDQIQRAFREK